MEGIHRSEFGGVNVNYFKRSSDCVYSRVGIFDASLPPSIGYADRTSETWEALLFLPHLWKKMLFVAGSMKQSDWRAK